MKKKIRVIYKGQENIFIHNDLQNAAFYFKQTIESKLEDENANGIGLDCMACMTMLAFSFEAVLNFFGAKCVKKWGEKNKAWLAFDEKVDVVFETLKLKLDRSRRPHSAIRILQKFRNIVAHGKPLVKKFEKVKLVDADKADRINNLEGKWEKYCEPHTVLQVYEDMDHIWKALFEQSGLKVYDTITTGDSSFSVVPDNAPQEEMAPLD